jgi:hypothetical protein
MDCMPHKTTVTGNAYDAVLHNLKEVIKEKLQEKSTRRVPAFLRQCSCTRDTKGNGTQKGLWLWNKSSTLQPRRGP